MPRFVLDVPDAEWQALRRDFYACRERGWRADLDKDAAGVVFARAAMLVGARLLAAAAPDVERAGRVLRDSGAIEPAATEGQAAAAAVGAALALGLPRLLEGERAKRRRG